MRKTIATLALLALASFAHADVLVSDSDSIASTVDKHVRRVAVAAHGAQISNIGHTIKPGEKRRRGGVRLSAVIQATGSAALIDSVGLKYFINTNITFSTSSSASGAMSEASYTHAVAATTSAGGVASTTLNDGFDGYGAMCVSLTNATGPCQTGNAAYTMYNKNGPASVDATVPAIPQCTNRQYVFAAQTVGGLSVRRKIYVPTNDAFARSLNFFTNTTGAPITFTMVTSNNLGSDSNTRVVTTSSGDAVVTTADRWITSFQNYSGNTSSDPRLGHVIQGPGAPTPVSNVNFVDGDDNPYWTYPITLAPGQTKAIMNFVTGQATKAAAATQAAALTALPATTTQCMSAAEISQVVNFAISTDLSITKTAPATVSAGGGLAYTLTVTNNGPATANSVSVSDTLPAGLAFVSATGTGWTCSFAAGTVTCTQPTLAVGAANPITINVTAPGIPGTLISNTATVSSATSDPTPANNSATAATTVVVGTAAKLAFTASPPATLLPGGPFSVTVAVEDSSGNVVTSNSSSVTVALTTAGGAVLSGTTTVAAINGVATFSNLSVNKAGTYTLTATDGGLTAAQSSAFAIITLAAPIPSLGHIALALMLTLLAFLGFRKLSGRRR